MAVSAYALRVDAQFVGIRLHPADSAPHVFDTGRKWSLPRKAVVHVGHHVALHGIIHHQSTINDIIL